MVSALFGFHLYISSRIIQDKNPIYCRGWSPLHTFPRDVLSIWYKDDFFLSEKPLVRLRESIYMHQEQMNPQVETEQVVILKVTEKERRMNSHPF